MTRAPGGQQRVMDPIGPIVDQRLPRYRRYQPAGFVHQKVGCRKSIPIMAVRPGESAIERAGGDARETQCGSAMELSASSELPAQSWPKLAIHV